MEMQTLINEATQWALQESSTYGTPLAAHIELANRKGQALAQLLGADNNIVLLGTLLMDIKLGECVHEGKASEHVQRSKDATAAFLTERGVHGELAKKILNCVEAHHGHVPYMCIEAEICANADCYRFLHPTGILGAFMLFGSRSQDYIHVLGNVEKKMDEKWGILSLDACKAELRCHYEQFKAYIAQAREEKV